MVAGHDPAQALIQRDGHPALGWVRNLRREGTRLLADIKGVPKKVAGMIRAGQYRKVSPEIAVNVKRGDKTYPLSLYRLGLLGADIPANPFVGFANLYNQEGVEVRTYSVDLDVKAEPAEPETIDEDIDMSSNEDLKLKRIAELESELGKARAAEKRATELELELEKTRTYSKEVEARMAAREKIAFMERVKGAIEGATISDKNPNGKILPKSAVYLYALAEDDGKAEEIRTYSRGETAIQYKDRADLIGSLLESLDGVKLGGVTTKTDQVRQYSADQSPEAKLDAIYAERETELRAKGLKVDPKEVFEYAVEKYGEEVRKHG